jgi:hypothetical protein
MVVAALAATAAVFAFARPEYRTPDQRTVDLARVHHFGRAVVRRTFAAHGIRLRYSNDKVRGGGPLWLSPTPIPVPTSGLYVIFAGRTGTVSWGPATSGEYDQPVGNLDVHYGGGDAATLAAVKSAVAELSSAA